MGFGEVQMIIYIANLKPMGFGEAQMIIYMMKIIYT